MAALTGLMLLACQPDSGSPLIFSGVCDASATVRIERGRLLVAYDEVNSVYAFDSGGGSVLQSYRLNDVLDLTEDSEMDLEAAALHDSGIWWIGSHGRDGDAAAAPNRELLFKTNIPSPDTNVIGLMDGPYNLTEVLNRTIGELANAGDFKTAAPKNGGINIEGLAVNSEGNFLIGMRSPLSAGSSGEAFVLQLVLDDGVFAVVDSHQLDLDDRGVRDLALTDDGFLLIAGGVAGGGRFSIYEWSVSETAKKLLDLPAGFNAESLVNMGSHWLVMSDDGKIERPRKKKDNTTCDKIFRNSPAENNESVFFRGLILSTS